jgi:AcrR family transcriptional regulator
VTPLAHEVLKRVGSRSYRYRVESYRDPSTGKVRGHWTYLGRAIAGGATVPPTRRSPTSSRPRLLVALESLLERGDLAEVTAALVAAEAGLASGTFYRYFRDKHDALRAAVEQTRDEVDQTVLLPDRPVGARSEERQRVRRWAETALRARIERPGLVRAWLAAAQSDAAIAAQHAERRARALAALTAYLERLHAAGIGSIQHARGTALALLSVLEAKLRAAASGQSVDDDEIEGVLTLIDRAIFCNGM